MPLQLTFWILHGPESKSRNHITSLMCNTSLSQVFCNAVCRIGGGEAWAENAKLRQAGEMRLLREFPDDPKTTWSQWKQRRS